MRLGNNFVSILLFKNNKLMVVSYSHSIVPGGLDVTS
jgi:hypothetical protein